ncbi:MAG: 16S rRNA (guanine(966)-N(2))-methyltransferase RsmD [Treponema sp.]|nr:16S rRNA (guanine(966)-N(2))-methyltransferase RsmD [Treponema sp.]
MRITGGKLKGRTTEVPGGKMAIRPAMDRMRESIFDIIGPELAGKSFLDLFSGSGTIAIEAVSHGASEVSLCEMDRAKAKTVLKNVSMTESVGVRIDCHFMAVELFLKRCRKTFDYIFFDPPFPYRFRQQLVETVESRKLLNEGGKLLIHHPSEDPLPEKIGTLTRIDQRIYGRSIVDFFQNQGGKEAETEEKLNNPKADC